jgi:hypothetical protein
LIHLEGSVPAHSKCPTNLSQHSLTPTIWSDIVVLVGRESGYLKIFFYISRGEYEESYHLIFQKVFREISQYFVEKYSISCVEKTTMVLASVDLGSKLSIVYNLLNYA